MNINYLEGNKELPFIKIDINKFLDWLIEFKKHVINNKYKYDVNFTPITNFSNKNIEKYYKMSIITEKYGFVMITLKQVDDILNKKINYYLSFLCFPFDLKGYLIDEKTYKEIINILKSIYISYIKDR